MSNIFVPIYCVKLLLFVIPPILYYSVFTFNVWDF